MARVIYSAHALADFERLHDFLVGADAQAARRVIPLILSALEILVHHPLIGRPCEAGLRELVISRGQTGYVALYRYDPVRDLVHVLGVLHQRELPPQT